MNDYKIYREADVHRGGASGYTSLVLKLLRKIQFPSNSLSRKINLTIYKLLTISHGIEIPTSCKIGKGFVICHPFNITINPGTTIGENCEIHKGVLIGRQNRGKRQGCPTIGNCVWMGPNAVIVGNISIGDDVLIAPNSFVNTDIPSHSIVYGNPCIIKHSDNATEKYINNKV